VTRVVLVATALALAAVPAALASPRYAFGRAGGNIEPFTVTISAAGTVGVSGPVKVGRTTVTPAELAALARTVAQARLSTLPARTFCTGSLPDFASSFVTSGGRTVYVRGGCSPRLTRVWNALAAAVRLAQ
jgi:hypothetical protein